MLDNAAFRLRTMGKAAYLFFNCSVFWGLEMRLGVRQLIASLVCIPMIMSSGLVSAEARDGQTRFILAVSWEPAFCATNRKKAECRAETSDSVDAKQFSLHGLWPMRQDYCGVSDDVRQADRGSDWGNLPPVQLSPEAKAKLDKVMPGTQSNLERHEWIKHGTCTKLSPDAYFGKAAGLVDELNASAVGALFAQNVGKTLEADAIKAAFDKSFGDGASDRVKMSCRQVGGTRVISELTIGLSQDAVNPGQGGPKLGSLIQGAGHTSFGCNAGTVATVGR